MPWDQLISGLHAFLSWTHGKLQVRRRPGTTNPIMFRGEIVDEFSVNIGEVFVIGETTFSVLPGGGLSGGELPTPHSELTCGHDELRRLKYADADERIEVLAALPEVIRNSPSDEELEVRVVDVLLRGISRAAAAAVVRMTGDESTEDPSIELRAQAWRDGRLIPVRASRRLVNEALRRRRQSVMHLWHAGEASLEFTVGGDDAEWAMCAPLPDDPEPGWALYVTGRPPREQGDVRGASRDDLLKSDLKFAEVVAELFGSLRQVRDLQRRQGQLARFFPVPVMAALAHQDMEEVLRPRVTDITVLFCDLRGSCRIAEEGEDELFGTMGRLSEALSIMTSSIADQDGVIGDFHGDAAMGFWGWPIEGDRPAERACRAALNIRRRFVQAAQQSGNPLAGFACGIGIASGPAVAGRLGTVDQFKVSVFGPVVNLAARLESMTKQFQVSVLLDEATTEQLRAGSSVGWYRCRRVAKLQPYGMKKVLNVSELLPTAVEPGQLSDRSLRDYEAALDAFIAGRWADSRDLLRRLPKDGPAGFLSEYMKQYGQHSPTGWDGYVALEAK